MLVSLYVMIGSGLLLTVLFFLYRAETIQGRRFLLGNLREKADRSLSNQFGGKVSLRRYFGASALRLFFHYVLHQVLNLALRVIRVVEERLNYLRRHNRLIARNVEVANGDSHLHHIAKHKEEVALSPEEIEDRKERSMND